MLAECLIVCPGIKLHREACLRRDSSTRGVEREFTDGDTHAIRPQIAQPQDSFAVCDDDALYVLLRPVLQGFFDMSYSCYVSNAPLV
jgi:hypothetical protein